MEEGAHCPGSAQKVFFSPSTAGTSPRHDFLIDLSIRMVRSSLLDRQREPYGLLSQRNSEVRKNGKVFFSQRNTLAHWLI